MIVLFFVSAIANAGGIGGGGLVVPILMVILQFYTHEAIPLSKLMIFAGAITSYILGFKIKHPFRNAVAIEYNIPMLLCPMLLLGTMVGVTLNKVLPPIVIIVSLTLVLIYNTFKTFRKGKQLYLKESKENKEVLDHENYKRHNQLDKSLNNSHYNKYIEEKNFEMTTTNVLNGSIELTMKKKYSDKFDKMSDKDKSTNNSYDYNHYENNIINEDSDNKKKIFSDEERGKDNNYNFKDNDALYDKEQLDISNYNSNKLDENHNDHEISITNDINGKLEKGNSNIYNKNNTKAYVGKASSKNFEYRIANDSYSKENDSRSITNVSCSVYSKKNEDDSVINFKNSNKGNNSINKNKLMNRITQENSQELLLIELKKDLRKFPFDKFIFMIIAYIGLLLTSFVKGSDHYPSILGIESCSVTYWFIYLLYLPFALILTIIIAKKIKNEYEYKKAINYPFNKQDIKWDLKLFIKFPLLSCFSGCLAGMLGIGGGLILAPVLLEIGLHPIVSSATSNFLVLFTSSSTSLQFIILGMMRLDYGISLTCISMAGSFLGTKIIQQVIEKTGRYSYLIFTLSITLLISAILIPGEAIFSFFQSYHSIESIFTFKSPC